MRVFLVIVVVATALFAQHSTNPVLLVNGFQLTCPSGGLSVSGTFGQLPTLLAEDGALSVDFFDVCSPPGAGAAIEVLAGLLSAKIQSYPAPVDVIAHSMGGLVVRAYLEGRTGGPYLNPPINPNIRKLVFLGSPHAGVTNTFALWPSSQTSEMQFGSPFLWYLGTWNQLRDDLRGIDAIAVAGTAGINAQGVPWDGVVDVSSASLDFVDSSGTRTRVVPYCHTGPPGDLLCNPGAPWIAYVTDRSHLSYQLIRAFLDGTNDWTTIAPPASSVSTTGGMTFTLSGPSGGFYNSPQLYSVALAKNGTSFSLSTPDGSSIWSSHALPSGSGYTLTMNLAGQQYTVSGVSIPAGGFVTAPVKFPPAIAEILPAGGIPPGALSVAGDSFVSLYGTGLASKIAQGAVSPLPYQLADVSVTIGGAPVQLSYASPQQINALLPSGLAPGLYSLALTNSLGTESINLMVENAVPSLFTYGSNAVSAEDAITGQLIGSSNPAAPGQYVAVFGTGMGPTRLSNGLNVDIATPSVSIGGLPAAVSFAGRAPGYPGLDQINVRIPNGLQPGNVPVIVTSGNRTSNTAFIAVQ
ncbi:MAG TPA: hypothetical protein VHW09_29225 [Bryobacteraceae bacterium]|nr:hypothetical protein [Bryobacteraceae bacterium]